MNTHPDRLHLIFIAVSFGAAVISVLGIMAESPFLYAGLPGLLGAAMAVVATLRFFKQRTDLAGFVITSCGFIFYQAYQLNPVMLPEFALGLAAVPLPDQALGMFLANFTTGLLLIGQLAARGLFQAPMRRWVPQSAPTKRAPSDALMLAGFAVIYLIVALPNVLFGKVVVGALTNIINQRAAWSDNGMGGFAVWGGPLGASLVNVALWATSLFFVWVYLLGSRHRVLMWCLGPLVLIWTAGVAFQGSRTYLVMIAFGLAVYVLGNPRYGLKAIRFAVLGLPAMFVLLQIASLFRTTGLQALDVRELTDRMFEIRGNEGALSQMDGLEFFRTELLAKEAAPNPVLGFVRGIIERPVEGLLMPVPRTLFPWKPFDETAREFTLFYQNVRLGTPSDETFLGASPGLIGRELIRYGLFGPITVLLWLGAILALADRLYAVAPQSDFHRMFAAVLVAFAVAQMRDWVPMWVLPFLPVMAVLFVAMKQMGQRRSSSNKQPHPQRSGWPARAAILPRRR